jgi:hypothetical protein
MSLLLMRNPPILRVRDWQRRQVGDRTHIAGSGPSQFRQVFPIRNKANACPALVAQAITYSVVIALSRLLCTDVSDKQQCLYRLAPSVAHGLSIR